MDKRENLRNPDLLPFDYVSVLIEWQSNPSLVFRVVKVLKSSIPFNAEMLSIAGSNGNNTVNFTFQSPFDVLTSPWQFELEASFTAAAGRYRPTAVYNASNNLVVVKFPTLANIVPSGSFVVFTAKRYRPSTQYLAELAAASASPVSIQAGGGATQLPLPNAINYGSPITTSGFYFTAPTDFTITSLQFLVPGSVVSGVIKILQLNAPLPTNNFSILYDSGLVAVNSLNVSVFIASGSTIAIFSRCTNNTGVNNAVTTISPASSISTTISGNSVTLTSCSATTSISSNLASTITNVQSLGVSLVGTGVTYGGPATWSNIIY